MFIVSYVWQGVLFTLFTLFFLFYCC